MMRSNKKILFESIELQKLDSIKFLLDNQKDINFLGKDSISALHIACGTNNVNIFVYLLSKTANLSDSLSAKNAIGLTLIETSAIRNAREGGNDDIIIILLHKYQETNTEISDKILLSVDLKLQYGPSWIKMQFRKKVHEILKKNIDWSVNDIAYCSLNDCASW